MNESKGQEPLPKFKWVYVIYGVIALSVALKVSNLMATLVVVSSVEDQLLRLHNLFLRDPEAIRDFSSATSINLDIFTTKVSQICSSIHAQVFCDGVIVVCLVFICISLRASRSGKKTGRQPRKGTKVHEKRLRCGFPFCGFSCPFVAILPLPVTAGRCRMTP